MWIDYISESGLTEDRYVQAVETKPGPGARTVMHHLLTYLIQDVSENEKLVGQEDVRQQQTETFLNEYAVGKNGDILPDGTGKLMKAGAKIRFNIHYHSSGQRDRRSFARRHQVLSKGLRAEVPPDLAADRVGQQRAGHPGGHGQPAATVTTASTSRCR